MNPISSAAEQRADKIERQHLERWAIVYVRQSSRQQVQQHRESAEVQANLRKRAADWGWPEKRISVLDGDQARSATTTDGRDDFAWLLSEIALGHVGLVLGFQINRLVREDEATCRLIKACAVFNTLVADEDGLYDPRNVNDRLVLNFKGLMGGFELHLLQQRMQAGRLNRARRGEWMGPPPAGYIVGPTGKLQFDPDEQAQHVIRMALDQFAAMGSISGVLRYLHQHRILWPLRADRGPQRGQLQWRLPRRESLRLMVHHPAYAGAYTWGRRFMDQRRVVPGKRRSGQRRREAKDCPVFLPDNHPAYISWEQHQSNLQRLQQHRRRGPQPGPARKTTATLAGLVVCGHCGYRMQTRYTRTLRYDCQRRAMDYGESACYSLVGEPLEQLVSTQILQVVTPASLELSQHAAEQIERERQTVDRQWQLRLQRARQETDRAYRQYNAVEPENRLVARHLEGLWEKALLDQRALQEEYHRFQQTRPIELSTTERAQIEALAHDLPALWHSPRTSVADKRQVLRLLLQQVKVWVTPASAQVKVQLHWIGGAVTEHQACRPVHAGKKLQQWTTLVDRVRAWKEAGWSSSQIAEELNATGQQTSRGKPFTAANVRQLLKRHPTKRKRAAPKKPSK
jgi:DNA invertase Pin-like site-specific DNA recombinase/G:T/U-mismatch repair DNA glycosylase